MTRQITASAPGKLMLMGDHSVVYGHPCIVTAVDQRISVSVRENGVDVFHLSAPDMGLEAYSKTMVDLGKKELPKGVRFIEMLYKRFLEKHPQKCGIVVTTQSEFSSNFGFGSSSAVTVAFAKALTTLYGLKLNNKQLFELCYQAMLDVQGVGSGFDIASAIWGGTIYYVSPAKVVRPLAQARQLSLVVGYTGIKADTPTIVRMVESLKVKKPEKVDRIFSHITELVERAVIDIEKNDWLYLGKLFNQNQILLQELGVSSVELDRLITASVRAHAFGAKLSGAGGGDCMIAVVDQTDRDQVESAIVQNGGEVMHVKLHATGVKIETED